MEKATCSNCKYWERREELAFGLCSMLRHHKYDPYCLLAVEEHFITGIDSPGDPIYMHEHFYCCAFEERQKGPFYVSQCGGIDSDKNWFVMADLDGTHFVRHAAERPIGGPLSEEDATETVDWLNRYWSNDTQPCVTCVHWYEGDSAAPPDESGARARHGRCPIYWHVNADSKKECHLYEKREDLEKDE